MGPFSALGRVEGMQKRGLGAGVCTEKPDVLLPEPITLVTPGQVKELLANGKVKRPPLVKLFREALALYGVKRCRIPLHPEDFPRHHASGGGGVRVRGRRIAGSTGAAQSWEGEGNNSESETSPRSEEWEVKPLCKCTASVLGTYLGFLLEIQAAGNNLVT